MTTICASCTSFSVDSPTLSSSKKKPQWLDEHDFVSEFIEKTTSFKPRKPTRCDQRVDFNMGKKGANRTILYWAADSSDSIHVQGARQAYAKFDNYGIVKLDENGCGKLFLRCPQIYRVIKKGGTKPQSYYRHFHVVVANKELNQWLPQIYTQVIICKKNLKCVLDCIDRCNAVVLNALPCEYYGQDHIPGSYNLTASQVKKMSANQLAEWMMTVMELHYPKLHKMVKSKKIEVNEVPIICYCAHEKCNASEMLEKELLKKGMVRVESFPGGMKEYRK